jgi:DNA-binding transcriptional MerR regulator
MGAKKKAKPGDVLIPDKLYFRIGEVARLAQLPAYVLRFWETEFPQLKPVKSNKGQRMYRQRDVELVLHIKSLVHEQGFTIAGARDRLKAEAKPAQAQFDLPLPKQQPTDELKHVRRALREILVLLSTPLEKKPSREKSAAPADIVAS